MSEGAAFMIWRNRPKKAGGRKGPKRTPGANPGQKEEGNSGIALAQAWANFPRSALRNRASAPLALISRMIAL